MAIAPSAVILYSLGGKPENLTRHLSLFLHISRTIHRASCRVDMCSMNSASAVGFCAAQRVLCAGLQFLTVASIQAQNHLSRTPYALYYKLQAVMVYIEKCCNHVIQNLLSNSWEQNYRHVHPLATYWYSKSKFPVWVAWCENIIH